MRLLFFLLTLSTLGSVLKGAIGEPSYIEFKASPEAFPLAAAGEAPPIVVDPNEWAGVVRAARDLGADLEAVTGIKITVDKAPAQRPLAILVGTIGKSTLIGNLVREGKLDISQIDGQWESWVTEVVDHPMPGVEQALVIAGSDKRGTIYGIYDLSEQIGVSPWYWWADVPAPHHDLLFVKKFRVVHPSPSVKYRGIFINDEAPALTNWVAKNLGHAPQRKDPPVPKGVANYGHEFYARIFETLLRLRGNYVWPAMWNNAFNEDDPINAKMADEFGVVMGTSHQEPMLRSQMEWDRRYLATLGHWNYTKHADLLEAFWREGVRRNRSFESIYTMGLRGANDTEMAPGGPAANQALLEKIVSKQRDILAQEVGSDLSKIPQIWCLYKEVQEYYQSGMRVPDDVTLLWTDDNWGNLRRLPTPEERRRSGGAGVYYHFDYVGGPRCYKWLDTNPLPKVWEQLSLAAASGADRVWIVNVGHFKGYERPLEFFLNFAWNTQRWDGQNLQQFGEGWATREFGPEFAPRIAEIVRRLAKYNGRRKPELLSPTTYSLTNYGESDRITAEFSDLVKEAETLFDKIPKEKRDAYYQLVLFPTKASAVVNALYRSAGQNALFAKQGRASAAAAAERVQYFFKLDGELMNFYNTKFAGERWEHFMDQPHLGYVSWKDPERNNIDNIKLISPPIQERAQLGVAIEGSAEAWPGAQAKPRLGLFDSINRQNNYIEIFNRGRTPFHFSISADHDWIVSSAREGLLEKDQRISVSIDWSKVPQGHAKSILTVAGAGTQVLIEVPSFRSKELTRETLTGFVESQGTVSIEAAHFSKNVPSGSGRWIEIKDYGRTLSGMRAELTPDSKPLTPDVDSPALEYRFYIFEAGKVELSTLLSPTLSFIPGRPLRFAYSFDDDKPQVATVLPADFITHNYNAIWSKMVSDNAHEMRLAARLSNPGYHLLKIWAIDPALVVQKLVITRGASKESYLGPPESFAAGAR